MVLLVMQQGDCNAGATYQTLMNSIFSDYIGVFIYIYLDDMAIFSLTLDDHIKHCKLVIDRLKKEQFYISKGKMQFFAKELHLLGHVIKNGGIVMDPVKVDRIENWKIPTSKQLLMEFLGAVSFLAPGAPMI